MISLAVISPCFRIRKLPYEETSLLRLILGVSFFSVFTAAHATTRSVAVAKAAKPGLLDNALNFWLMHFFEYPKMHVAQNALRARKCM